MIHEIGRIDGGRGFRTKGNVFRIGGNTFYDWKNKIPMKILVFKRSGIGLIVEFCGILNGFPNQAFMRVHGKPTRKDYKILKEEASALASKVEDITYTGPKMQ